MTSSLSAAERDQALRGYAPDDLLHAWWFWARPEQLPPPGNWRVWLVMSGRGAGKTRTGAEWVRQSVQQVALVNIVGATADDARDIMIEGESGILAICPDHERPAYLPSKRRLEWPNGARTLIFTADEPDRLRGKQHGRLWMDEVASWRLGSEAFDQAMLGLRLGPDPRCVATTTPKPVKVIRDLLDRQAHGEVVVTRGTSYDNAANLAPAFFDQIIRRFEGTRTGRQELMGELLDDVEGALWTLTMIDSTRLAAVPDDVTLTRIVVGVDPPASATGAEAGIVVVAKGSDGRGYVLADYSRRGSPHEWATAAVVAFDDYDADAVVIEVNQGGDMAIETLKTVRRDLPIKPVHAARGKALRAQPVAALYEQGKMSHVGTFSKLEDQMCSWVEGDVSPDRLDGLCWGCHGTIVTEPRRLRVF